jgi:hypothetical protein
MKWKNKGHEFDMLGAKIMNLSAIYLFGAGAVGKAVFTKYKDKITIKGFIDSDTKKQHSFFVGTKVYTLGDVRLQSTEAIVLTVSPTTIPQLHELFNNYGYQMDVNMFTAHTFFPVFDMYKFGEVCLPSISFLPSTICNLKCKCCLNFSPYIKQQKVRPLDTLKSDLDLLFSKIDTLLTLHISGGEPFLYKELPELIEYIAQYSASKLGQLELTTNGTIVASDKLCQIMRDSNILLTVDDYRSALPQFESNYAALIQKLKQYGISYKIQKAENWIDLAPFDTDNSQLSEDQLCEHFKACAVPWQEYRDGKLWICNYSAYAEIAGIQQTEPSECYDMKNSGESNGYELMEFRLGYSEKGYTQFCKKCRGYGNNNISVASAEQI